MKKLLMAVLSILILMSQAMAGHEASLKQAFDELPLFLQTSMPPSKPPSHNPSARRLCSRRPRPSVASIADIFVGSLVLASFCHEHSPGRRGLSTISYSPSDQNLQRFRSKGTTGRRGLPPRRQPEYSSSRFHLSQPKRLISNGLASEFMNCFVRIDGLHWRAGDVNPLMNYVRTKL